MKTTLGIILGFVVAVLGLAACATTGGATKQSSDGHILQLTYPDGDVEFHQEFHAGYDPGKMDTPETISDKRNLCQVNGNLVYVRDLQICLTDHPEICNRLYVRAEVRLQENDVPEPKGADGHFLTVRGVTMMEATEVAVGMLVGRVQRVRNESPSHGVCGDDRYEETSGGQEQWHYVNHVASQLASDHHYLTFQRVNEATITLINFQRARNGCLKETDTTDALKKGEQLIALLGSGKEI